ncbi:recombinase [Nonomuraea sp. NPDC049141]
MLPRLDELEADLIVRRSRALHEGWLGEIEGIDLTLTFLQQKREQAQRHRRTTVMLGLPTRPGAPDHAP